MVELVLELVALEELLVLGNLVDMVGSYGRVGREIGIGGFG